MKEKLLLFIILTMCLPGLACNFPGRARPGASLTGKQLRQTLQAQAVATLPSPIQTSPVESVSTPTGLAPTPEPVTLLTSMPGAVPSPPTGYYSYLALSGDTLPALAHRFKLSPDQISSAQAIPKEGYITPGQEMWIPNLVAEVPNTGVLLPDSEVIYSPTSLDFAIDETIQGAGGFLSTFNEEVGDQTLSGADIIRRVSQESSVNPRLLLAFLEQRSGWVFGDYAQQTDLSHPLGFNVPGYNGLYQELVMAATHLNAGYYGWRSGERITLKFSDGTAAEMNPRLNAGSAAIQNLFAKFYDQPSWNEVLYGENNFLDFYQQRFGDPWARAAQVEPLLTPSLTQPVLELPFAPGERWSYTGGPHFSWNSGSARGAIDFAPVTGEKPCAVSSAWALAAASGTIVRSAYNVVALDLDGDGNEQTGWVIIYLHIADQDRISAGGQVQVNDRIGHPSCERGQATGTNVHFARKYNGEWLPADGPLPLVLGGWEAIAGEKNYQGSLVNGNKQVFASPLGKQTSIVVR
jgi:LasA protease